MVQYETTVADIEAGVGGVYQTTVAPVPIKSSRSWIWKTFAIIVFLSLCAAASVLFARHLTKQDKKDFQILSGEQISTPSGHGKVLQQIAERTKAAIHLHGECGKSKELNWVSGVDQSFEQGGLRLEGNKIHIPADGLYFVYSQVSYIVTCKLDEDDYSEAQKYLSHSIYRYSDAMGPDPMPLQNSAHSVCQSGDNDKRMYQTVYLGAVFKLLEGDKLSTNTTNVGDIEDNYAKTFFGVFAL